MPRPRLQPESAPKPARRLTVTLPHDLWERVHRAGAVGSDHGSPSRLLERILREHLERYERS